MKTFLLIGIGLSALSPLFAFAIAPGTDPHDYSGGAWSPYLVGGMKAWDNAGFELAEVGQMTVHEIKDAGSRLQVVDVRSPDEWEKGHVPGAKHLFLPELREKSAKLAKKKPVAVYCDSGYRASIATSILKQEGFPCVCNVPGSWQAWKKAGFPVEGGKKK